MMATATATAPARAPATATTTATTTTTASGHDAGVASTESALRGLRLGGASGPARSPQSQQPDEDKTCRPGAATNARPPHPPQEGEEGERHVLEQNGNDDDDDWKRPPHRRRARPPTGLVFDERMLKHRNPAGAHPERPDRIRRIFSELEKQALVEDCLRLPCREASREELRLAHTRRHCDKLERLERGGFDSDRALNDHVAEEYESVYMNRASFECARLAVGGLLESVDSVLRGDVLNAMCVYPATGPPLGGARVHGFLPV